MADVLTDRSLFLGGFALGNDLLSAFPKFGGVFGVICASLASASLRSCWDFATFS
jgi:hypothetical protein